MPARCGRCPRRPRSRQAPGGAVSRALRLPGQQREAPALGSITASRGRGEKEAGPAARGDLRELPREGAAGPGRELSAPTSGVRWPVLPAGGHPDPLPGWLSAESGCFLPEAGLQRAGGVLCFLLSSGGILPLPAHLLFSLLPR